MRVITVQAKNDEISSLKILGHAGFAPAGSDIVCAACTTLCLTLANAAEAYEQKGLMLEEPSALIDSGDGFVEYRVSQEGKREMDAVFNAVMQSFRLLEEAYPQYIHLEIQPG